MKMFGKIIACSIAIAFVLIIAFGIIATYLMGYNVPARRSVEIDIRDKFVDRIESYISAKGRLPESLSSVGFKQTYGGYAYKGIVFDYIRLNDKEYVVEYTSVDGILTQYINTERHWAEEPNICYIEMPVNADTIAAINRISNFEQDYNIAPVIDSISYNHSQICPIDDYVGMPDSIAYIRYLYKNGNTRSEGWITYSDNPENDFSNEFGEWKYYDEEGNCYRRFWNYKQNGKLIYETDRETILA